MIVLVFWLIVFFLAIFLFYPFILFLIGLLSKKSQLKLQNNYPGISIIIAAFNEEKVIDDRIKNIFELNYPKEKIEIVVGSDGSTDETVALLRDMHIENLKVFDFKSNRGRSQVHNDCVKAASGEILFFTDADTLYEADCVNKMVRRFNDPEVGCVGGELRSFSFKESGVGRGQGIYWRWEYAIRRMQSRLGILTKVSGANMSMKRVLYRPLPEDVDIDQMAGPLTIMQGYKVDHETDAIAFETFPVGLGGEFSTRIRLTIRGLTALSRYKELLNPLKYGWISLNEIVYRLFRYLLPFFLIGLFISNIMILDMGPLYRGFFLAQLLFYSFAFVGFTLEKMKINIRLFSIPFSLVYFNLGILIGDLKFLKGERLKKYNPVD